MTLKVRHQGALRTISRLSVRVGGRLRQLRTLKVMHDGELRLVANFAPPMSLAVVPSFAVGGVRGAHPSMVISGTVTATPSGGQVPYRYVWSMVSGDLDIAATSPTSASSAFEKVLFHETATGTARVTCTDALGTSAAADVSITLEHLEEEGI